MNTHSSQPQITPLPDRQSHLLAVRAFLQQQLSTRPWEFSLPHGWGNETYFARGDGRVYFVKLGAPLANYQSMAALGLSPPVLASGVLDDGTAILVQPFISGRNPSWADFQHYLERMAEMVKTMQGSPLVRRGLPDVPSEQYQSLGLEALQRLRLRWQSYKPQVPTVAAWVDGSLDFLEGEIDTLDGAGAVVAHHDICNANWLITPAEQIYLLDLDAMALDDPAADLGALLWWYYPPKLRERFLEIAGYPNDAQFRKRMQLRMAIHCLGICLPRQGSFDRFDASNFGAQLSDFKAIIAGEENPHGYKDE